MKTHTFEIGGKSLSFETGKFALQADGAVLVRHGDTVLHLTAGLGRANPDLDFFPLTVDFEPKYYATGKVKGSRFNKREARPPESAILTARMMDRTMRPLFPKGMRNETQIIGTLFQSDALRNVGPTAITGASVAIHLAGIPIEAPFAGVRVGKDEKGDFLLDPTFAQCETGGMDLIVAGTADAITMVEAGMNEITEEETLEALAFAHAAIKTLCAAQISFLEGNTIESKEITMAETYEKEKEAVKKALTDADMDAITGNEKKLIKKGLKKAKEKLLSAYSTEIEAGDLLEKGLGYHLDKYFAKRMRERVFATGDRLDGRKADEVRPVTCEVGLFSRLHGTALFQRGETQALSVVTVGGPTDKKIIDDADRPELHQQYIHHYNFPPFSVGEVRRLRSPGRREIGHGLLAERALLPMIPTAEEGYPYFLRVVSEILTCNGSSSMASVCGSTLSLMDAGVPLKNPVSGVAMGLLMQDNGEYVILTDIQGFEDFDGDMDLKVCGTENGLTALQMDIKVKGLDLSLLKEAFGKAKTARMSILQTMLATLASPRDEMSDFAPRVTSFQIKPEMIRVVIGKGGETIQKITADFDVKIDIEDDGMVFVQSVNGEKAKGAIDTIKALVFEPEIGDIFANARVVDIKDFGAFVEYSPGKQALLHVSEISEERTDHPSDKLKKDQIITVKLIGRDKMGREKLSMKQAA